MRLLPTLALLFTLTAVSCADPGAAGKHVGQPLPPSDLYYFDGKVDLKDKPAIVEFWATWCGPCRAIIPHLNDLYTKYKEKGLVIVGVSLDEEKSDVEKDRAKLNFKYPIAFDQDKKLSTKLQIEAIPYALLLDKSGKVVWEGISSELTEETIEKTLH